MEVALQERWSSSASSQPMLSLDGREAHRRYSVAPLDDAWSWIRIRWFIRSSVHSLLYSFIHLFVRPFNHSFIFETLLYIQVHKAQVTALVASQGYWERWMTGGTQHRVSPW